MEKAVLGGDLACFLLRQVVIQTENRNGRISKDAGVRKSMSYGQHSLVVQGESRIERAPSLLLGVPGEKSRSL